MSVIIPKSAVCEHAKLERIAKKKPKIMYRHIFMPENWKMKDLDPQGEELKCYDDCFSQYSKEEFEKIYDPEKDLKLDSLKGVKDVIAFVSYDKQGERKEKPRNAFAQWVILMWERL